MFKTPDLSKWNELRQKGKWNYIINYGILRFGLSTWVIMIVYFWVFEPIEPRLIFTIISLITFPMAGLIWGRWMWYYLEKLYATHVDSQED